MLLVSDEAGRLFRKRSLLLDAEAKVCALRVDLRGKPHWPRYATSSIIRKFWESTCKRVVNAGGSQVTEVSLCQIPTDSLRNLHTCVVQLSSISPIELVVTKWTQSRGMLLVAVYRSANGPTRRTLEARLLHVHITGHASAELCEGAA